MNVNELVPTKYLKPEHLQGKRVAVEIESITIEELGADKEKKPVMHFVGKEKYLVLNKTKLQTLAMILNSEETDDWVGAQIFLRPGITSYKGEMKKCIDIDSELPERKVTTRPEETTQSDSHVQKDPDEWDDDNPIF